MYDSNWLSNNTKKKGEKHEYKRIHWEAATQSPNQAKIATYDREDCFATTYFRQLLRRNGKDKRWRDSCPGSHLGQSRHGRNLSFNRALVSVEAQSMNIEEFLRELEKEQRRKSGGSSE
jgi:hypothetical protein